jgi:mannosyltransferase
MLYTHNWTLFFIAGSLVALAFVYRGSADKRLLLRDAALAYGAAAIAYLPWVPTLVDQTRHTGAPWSNTPSIFELFGGFLVVLNGQGAVVALILAGGVGLGVLLRTMPESRERTAVVALLWLAGATVLIAWLSSQFAPAWANRYLGVLVGPMLLLVAAVVPRAGKLGVAALLLVVIFWVPFHDGRDKSNARDLAALFSSQVGSDDVIISTHPEQVPVLAHYFGRDLDYATELGPFPDTRVMDWRGALDRLEAASPETTLEPILDELPVGAQVFLIRPLIRDDHAWSAPWTKLVRRRSDQWELALASDGRFRRTKEYVPPYTDRIQRPLTLEIFEKTAAG